MVYSFLLCKLDNLDSGSSTTYYTFFKLTNFTNAGLNYVTLIGGKTSNMIANWDNIIIEESGNYIFFHNAVTQDYESGDIFLYFQVNGSTSFNLQYEKGENEKKNFGVSYILYLKAKDKIQLQYNTTEGVGFKNWSFTMIKL